MNNQHSGLASVYTSLVDRAVNMVAPTRLGVPRQGADPITLSYLTSLGIRLAKFTGKQEYVKQAQHDADQLLHLTSQSTNCLSNEFINVARALLELDRFSASTHHYDRVSHGLLAATTAAATNGYRSNSFATGRAGLLMTLLQAYDYYAEPRLLLALNDVLEQLVDEAQLGTEGIYWDNGRNDVNFLCGFDQGNSGVGWVLAAVSAYFDQPAVGYLAQEAFRYEDAYFDQSAGNWPDWTKHIATADQHSQHLTQYQAQNWSFFDGTFTNYSFDSGLVGLLCARLRQPLYTAHAGALESPVQVALATLPALLAHPQWSTALDGVTRVCLHRLCQHYLPDCVRLSTDLLVDYLRMPFLPTLPLVQALYAGLSDQDNSFPPRPTTRFTGDLAGLPSLLKTAGSQLAHRMSRRHFPRTTTVLDTLNAGWWSAYDGAPNPLDFLRTRADWSRLVATDQRPCVTDVIKLEDQLLAKRNAPANWALINVAEIIGFSRGKNVLMNDDGVLLDSLFCLANEVTFVAAQWNWLDEAIDQLPFSKLSRIWSTPNPGDWALKCSSDKLRRVVIYTLTGFDSLLYEFTQSVTPRHLIEQLCGVEELLESTGAHAIQAIVLTRIKFFINEALIIPVSTSQ